MAGLSDYLPRRAWAAVLALALAAVGSLMLPASAGATVGLEFLEFFWLVAAVQLLSALGIAAVVLHYRDPDVEPGEWRFDP
jgi:hypothetical protein